MNDEIKEIKKLIAIVNCMKDSELLDNGEYYKVHSDFIISLEENKIQLLDYITNLQEENKRLQDRNIELVLERDRLKELCNAYEEEHSTTFEEWKQLVKEDLVEKVGDE